MRNLSIAMLTGMLAACSTGQKLVGGPALQVQSESSMPVPTGADIAPEPRTFVIGPRDYIRVSVAGLPDFSLDRVQIDNSGNVSIPVAGTVHANGRTPAELSQEITSRLQVGHVRNPQVAVNLVETQSQLVTVDGEVTTPGQYPVLGRMTLSRAVATAQGVTENANTNYVVIFRTVADKRYAALYNLKSIRAGLAEDPAIYPNDEILVGESRARRVFRDILAASPLLVTPLVVLLQSGLN